MPDSTRVAVSKRLRFEILRRDDHTCHYCGRSAPAVALKIDHVIPVTLGGRTEPANLVAACQDCNVGKSSVAPDAAKVAQVSADAVRWAAAMDLVAEIQREHWQITDELADEFDVLWRQWHLTGKDTPVPRPVGWRDSISHFLATGLTEDDLEHFVNVAMRKDKVTAAEKWTYFCGCCWRCIEERVREAQSYLARRGD